MSRMWLALSELHTYIYDPVVDKTFGDATFTYRRGVPLLITGPYLPSLIGAAVTPLPDSTNVVYSVGPDNPLQLERGDLVLGYEGIPWKKLYPQLIEAGLPVSYWYSWSGSSPASMMHFWVMSVTQNWGLFDTIDVVRYGTGDTVHLPTSLLESPIRPVWQCDEMPVPGVPMPPTQIMDGPVTWGVVEGTNIGYVYAWDWASSQTGQKFSAAIHDLCDVRDVDGLILDVRMNWGGDYTWANNGLSLIFNVDPTLHLRRASRDAPSHCMSFTLGNPVGGFGAVRLFQRPIAVLIGPGCFSVGDYNALRMRFHPMARLFGKATNGAFVAGTASSGQYPGGWQYSFPTSMTYSTVPGEGFMMHKGAEPDEEIWLTRDGAAHGEDNVVKRALEWISTLSHAYDVRVTRQSIDTVRATAQVTNPLGHDIHVAVLLYNGSGTLIDSLVMADNGLLGDSAASDGIWGCQFVPAKDDTLHFTVRTEDATEGTSRSLPNVVMYYFTRSAILSADSRAVDLRQIPDTMAIRDTSFVVRNIGYAMDSVDVTLNFGNVEPDSAVGVSPALFTLGAGDSTRVTFAIRPRLLVPQYYNAVVRVHSRLGFGQTLFSKTMLFQIVTSTDVAQADQLPRTYGLDQNYPNPFNPSTTIRYALPHRSFVTLAVYNTLGQHVAVLVQGEREAGYHEAVFDASGLASGVYLYRLQAGDFIQTKRLVLVR